MIVPNYRVATELKVDALKAKYKDEWYTIAMKHFEAWKSMVDSQDETALPYPPEFPKRDVRLKISKSHEGGAIHHEGDKEKEDADSPKQ